VRSSAYYRERVEGRVPVFITVNVRIEQTLCYGIAMYSQGLSTPYALAQFMFFMDLLEF